MKIPLFLLTLFLGVVLAVHLSMNGKVGSVLNNARVGNALFWCIGAAGAVAIGLFGATLVFAIAWLIPQAGAGAVMITLIAGQVIGGLVMSHFGWLGSPVQPITIMNIVGALVMLGGVIL